ncbi:30S ribosome-binding factor RbfA [Fulvivirga sp. M361]|uniref:30S ribosome-binding factor RbfA n=1 Tax=Fulvivirga sp. M361 TaxID=2594266 RepID=UPI00117A8D65|nr:30S ribosome-binding factor RbfA [Fulvivirga sp. M361]TRX50448.1 30S ribosome-binding factor RbfA [Fulvivirga sp. M361]
MTESKRQQKFSRLIQKDLSDIIQKDKPGIFSNSLVTVADVKVSPDLGIAKVYFSMMLVNDKKLMLEKINKHKSEFRRDLGNKISKQVRKVPELIFYIDEVEEQASRIDQIIDNLDIPEADSSDLEN